MSKIKVLFVDDDIIFGQTIVLGLEHHGFEVAYQTTLTSLADVIEEMHPDVIVLDVMIGIKNSIDTISEMKAVIEKIPTIIISSLTDSDTYVRALDLGAITFLRKPFKMIELVANIKRYVASNEVGNITFGDYSLCNSRKTLFYKNQPLKELTTKEYKLLAILAKNVEGIVTKEIIIDKVWEGDVVSTHSITNFIVKLRKYFSKDREVEIVAISGVGYKLSIPKKER